MKVVYRAHALIRMFQREISDGDIHFLLEQGETIEDYPEDFPYPSKLILGWRQERPLHVVAAHHAADDEIIIVTVYEPDQTLWDEDFPRRLV